MPGEVLPAVRSQAIANTRATTGENDSGPARSPQARVISDRNPTTAIKPRVRARDPSVSPTSSVTSPAAAAAGSTRDSTRCGGLGRSIRLAQTAPPTAARPAVSPNPAPTSAWVNVTPSATLSPFRWAASRRRSQALTAAVAPSRAVPGPAADAPRPRPTCPGGRCNAARPGWRCAHAAAPAPARPPRPAPGRAARPRGRWRPGRSRGRARGPPRRRAARRPHRRRSAPARPAAHADRGRVGRGSAPPSAARGPLRCGRRAAGPARSHAAAAPGRCAGAAPRRTA
mmetsp:Transcript_21606/g.51293  ORF Transcript_21606/g.51293 Transcript_21606/m.51293 type:complete len:285 (+) Transcript_21606:139-993(+)